MKGFKRHFAHGRWIGLPILILLTLLSSCGGEAAKLPPVQVYTLQEDSSHLDQYTPEPSRYMLGPGDLMRVSFLGEEVLNNNIQVTPDGYVSVPLLDGPLYAAGKTIDELKSEITEQLKNYLLEPQIYLHMVELGSQHVFVLGYVEHPHLASCEPLTLAGVISACGGINRDGQKKQVLVIRRNPGGEPIVFDVNFNALLEGRSLMPDIPLQRYDIVIVPKSRVAKVRDFVQAVFGNTIVIPRYGVDIAILYSAWQESIDIFLGN